MKAIIYTRVSSKDQAEYGHSLDSQERICKDYARRLGYEVIRVFVEEGESAKTTDRTQLKKLLDFISKHHREVNAIIVYKLDRLARNMIDYTGLLSSFSKLGIDVKSATENIDDSPAGKLTKNMIAAIAQFDNDVRSERTRTGMRQTVQQEGRWVWRAPLGYKHMRDDNKKPLIVPTDDSAFVIEAFELFATGLHTQRGIVAHLKSKGYEKMKTNLLNRILRNPLYCGLIKVSWLPDYIKGIHKAIISEELFHKVQFLLEGRRPMITPKVRNNPHFPLRNFIRCPKCGGKLTAGWSTGHKGTRHPYYHCRKGECSVNVRKDTLETKFYEYLESFQPTQEALNLFSAIVLDVWNKKQEERIKEEYRLERQLRELAEKKNRIDELMIKGTFDEATYKERVEEVNNAIAVKKIELSEAQIELNDVEACLGYGKAVMGNVAKLWANADLNLKQRFQTFIFPEQIHWNGETFGTTATSILFKQLQLIPAQKSDLVALTGFEPVYPA